MEAAGVTLVFEKVDLTSVPGNATEWIVQGLMTEEPEEGGVTSTSQHRFVGNAWCHFDRIIWACEIGVIVKGKGYFSLLMRQRAITHPSSIPLCPPVTEAQPQLLTPQTHGFWVERPGHCSHLRRY